MREFIFLKNNAKCSQIFFHDLQYIEAVDKYVRFVTIKKAYLVLGSMSFVEKRLPADQFCRIHRSYIVSFAHVTEFNSETVIIAGKELPIGKQYKDIFHSMAPVLYADRNAAEATSNKDKEKEIQET